MTDEETEAPTGEVGSLRPHSESVAEMFFEPRSLACIKDVLALAAGGQVSVGQQVIIPVAPGTTQTFEISGFALKRDTL